MDLFSHMGAAAASDGGWKDVDAKPKSNPPKKVIKTHLSHRFVQTPLGRRCRVCLAFPGSSPKCRRHPAGRVRIDPRTTYASSAGHVLWRTGPFVWCWRCARHPRSQLRDLSAPCSGAVQQRWWCRNLAEGHGPKTPRARVAEFTPLGLPRRLLAREWRDFATRRTLADLDGSAAHVAVPAAPERRLRDLRFAGEGRPRAVFRLGCPSDGGAQAVLPWVAQGRRLPEFGALRIRDFAQL